MPRIDPWAQQFKRPEPQRRTLHFTDPDWSLTLRQPEPGERDAIRDRQLEYQARYVSGIANEDGKPQVLTTPTVPSRKIIPSATLFNFVAALETLVVPEEGDEPPSMLEIIGWRDNLEPHWRQITAAIDLIWSGRMSAEQADPNPEGATDTGKTSDSPSNT
jgi:hypothetical protein